MAARKVAESSLGAWVFTVNGARWDSVVEIASQGGRLTTRCVAANYRKDVMAARQRALLWVSGPPHGPRPRGIAGLGWITGPSEIDPENDSDEPSWLAHTDIRLLADAERVRATDLGEIPGVAGMEILRLPQASNPSWVTRAEMALIEPLLPEWPDPPRAA
ncbi:hypothetical protein OG579_11500 [Williamsia herbipolensis]|uniref:EVE domain-containing protein n=1 Tax=Williamsia herbipolensis TaxID=1603258 RepID=A0AAU4JX86_9NOCA|nr:hypothetical protein [Williamsia herbipolensis]